jgi:ArsR family transcriptional regulator
MKLDTPMAAARLAALGHEHRLELFKMLVRAGRSGLTIGELQSALGRPASTVGFHLRELVAVGLVTQEREGRSVRCNASFPALDAVLQYMKHDCCQGVTLPAFASRRAG